ncbi:MAG: pectinesterase family protein [Chloroflexota bacterium]
MNRKQLILTGLTVLLLTLGWGNRQTLAQAAQRMAAMASVGTAFTYQGSLEDNGVPANGSYDFEFSLYPSQALGSQIGSTIAQTIVVSNGRFTTSLDFGADAFNGQTRYLEIAVQLGGGGGFTTLTPRQPLSTVPYATYANKLQPVGNVIVVAKSGGDFTTLTDALASITTASASNPYLIKIAPGVYQEQVDLKDYVDIEGSGEGATILRGLGGNTSPNTDGSSATLRATGVLNTEVRWLTVESDGAGNDFAVAIWADGTTETFSLHHITATAFAGSDDNHGIFNETSSPTMNYITASATGGANSIGVINLRSSPTMEDVVASASGSTHDARGIYNLDAAPIMDNVTASASGGSRNFGIINSNDATIMNNVITIGSGGDASYGVFNEFSAVTMNNVTAIGEGGVLSVGVNNTFASTPMLNNVTASALNGTDNYGIYISAAATLTLDNVIASASGGSNSYGIYNNSSSAQTMENVTASATGGTITTYGIYNDTSSPMMDNVTASASGPSDSYGVYNDDASPTMNNVIVTSTASGTASSYGIYNDASSSPTMDNVTAHASGGGASFGVYNDDTSSPIILDSALTGVTNSIFNVPTSSVHLASTLLDGSLFGASVTYTCFNNYDASFAAVTCP